MRQKLELFEAISGCETKNRYKIVGIPSGAYGDKDTEMSSKWTKPYRDQSEMNSILIAKEESDCMERICCPLFRGFTMKFTDAQANNWFTLERPFKCDPCHCPACFMCNTQEMTMRNGNGAVVGTAKEKTNNCMQLCSRTFLVSDQADQVQYKMVANE